MTETPTITDEPTVLELELHTRYLKLLAWTTLTPTPEQTEKGLLPLSAVFTDGKTFYVGEASYSVAEVNHLVDHGEEVDGSSIQPLLENYHIVTAREAYELREEWVQSVGWPEFTDGEVIASAADKVPAEYEDLFRALAEFVDDLKTEHFHTLSLTDPSVRVAMEAVKIAWSTL